MRILLNCAISRDGYLAGPGDEPVLLSDETDLRRVHSLRAAVDAILVGSGTVLQDDPSLRVKPHFADGPDPLRVILDRRGRTPSDARVMADGNVLVLDAPDVKAAVATLAERGIRSLLVEGGAQVWKAFWRAAWDEATVYVAPRDLGKGLPLPGYAAGRIDGRAPHESWAQGEGTLLRWLNRA